MRRQEFEHESIGHKFLVVQGIEQGVMPKAGPTFVHHLGLTLRIKVLGHFANNAYQFAFPVAQFGRFFLDKVQNVFDGLTGVVVLPALNLSRLDWRHLGHDFIVLTALFLGQVIALYLQ